MSNLSHSPTSIGPTPHETITPMLRDGHDAPPTKRPIRLLEMLFNADFRESLEHRRAGGRETYGAQEYTMGTTLDLANTAEELTVVGCATSQVYDTVSPEGVRMIGGGLSPIGMPSQGMIEIVQRVQPTHILLRFPHRKFIQWLTRQNIRLLLGLADSFDHGGLKEKIKNRLLARTLRHPRIEYIANHQVNAARSLVRIGVPADKVIPYDLVLKCSPTDFEPKPAPTDDRPWQACYVGQVTVEKGVGDAIDAVARLKQLGRHLHLKIAGKGDITHFEQQAKRLGVEDRVELLGMIENHRVTSLMRDSDLVFVLSHHCYPEGLPLTLIESLCTRTPLVVSDHQMFQNKVTDGVSGMIVPERSPQAVAEAIARLMNDADLYETISANTQTAWQELQIPVFWDELIRRWVNDTPTDHNWLTKHTLGQYAYG